MYLGVDPGANGGAVLITHAQQVASVLKFKDATEDDIARWIEQIPNGAPADLSACCEHVHSMPKQGVASSFKFGVSYGVVRGILAAHKIRRSFVSPSKWQRAIGCLSKGDKNVTKAKAQELFPHEKWTHATADAVLIAEYCRRSHETSESHRT